MAQRGGALALLGAYDDSDDDEEESGDDPSLPRPVAGHVGSDADEDGVDDVEAHTSGGGSRGGQGAEHRRSSPAAAAAAAAAHSVPATHALPSVDDLLDGWDPSAAPSKRPATSTPHPPRTFFADDAGEPEQAKPAERPAKPSAPRTAPNGMALPPQVGHGRANRVTEDQAHRTAAAQRASNKAPAPPGWRQKEKRKREIGQQAGSKDWVQDEKRILRHSGVNYDA